MRPPVALWLTADREDVVADGDPRSAFLLAGAGCDIPADEIRRLGVEKIEAALGANREPAVVVPAPVDPDEKQDDEHEDKQAGKDEDKAEKPARRKRGG